MRRLGWITGKGWNTQSIYTGRIRNIIDDIEDADEPDEGYLFHAVVSYHVPTKFSIGVYAEDLEEARELIEMKYAETNSFKIIHLAPATPDISRQLLKEKTH